MIAMVFSHVDQIIMNSRKRNVAMEKEGVFAVQTGGLERRMRMEYNANNKD
jgi:hypothetical protein